MSTNSLVSTTKLGEYFAKLPVCKADRTNQIFFQNCFLFTVDAAGLSDHFENRLTRMTSEPTEPTVIDPTKEEKETIKQYPLTKHIQKSKQAVIKQGITSVIPDLLFLKVKKEKTARKIQNKVTAEYEKKSKIVIVDLWRKLQDKKCSEGEDVKAHLTKLQTIQEGLIAMEPDPNNEKFVAIVLESLPALYEIYLSTLTSAVTLLGKTLNPDVKPDNEFWQYK